ncbi:hypothetical protein HHI36_005727 [Cryptolaemus montrouzieri]|uniref:Uncharacterized protein n=1 Tax=Cryptolaemus montrouzieri TaxID=559131 RepID=A0ABD2NV03_9CUCU
MNQNFITPMEAKRVNIMKFLRLRGKIDSSIKIVNNSFYCVDTKYKQESCIENISPNKNSIYCYNAEVFENDFPSSISGTEENGFMYGRNFWFKIFYYFQNKYRFPTEKHGYIKKS